MDKQWSYRELQNKHDYMKAPARDNKIRSQQQQQPKQLSSWQKLVHGIVRPPRSTARDPLGTSNFRLNEEVYVRSEYSLTHEGKKLELTVFDPHYKSGWVILYLHGNSSSKVECYSIREYLPFKYSLASFDFMGCGRNFQEDTVSLGFREAAQVETVVGFLWGEGYRVVIWGRSMGAVSALRCGKASAIVADSAFKSFRSVCKHFAKSQSPCYVPNCLISCLFPCFFWKMRSDVEELGHYDIQNLDITESVRNMNPNTLLVFLSADEDVLIDKRNSQQLYELYAGKHKHIEIFKGDHNSKRPAQVLKRVMALIQNFNQHQERLFQGKTSDLLLDQVSPK